MPEKWTAEYKREYQREYRRRNRKKLRTYHRKWRSLNKDRWIKIQKRSRSRNKSRVKAESSRYYKKHRKRLLTKATKYNKAHIGKARREIFKMFGGRCQKCGFSDKRALQIDHKKGGGSKHIRSFSTTYQYYKYVLMVGSKEFQLLCANCNWIKRVRRGEV